MFNKAKHLAKRGTYEEFMEVYTADLANVTGSIQTNLLFDALDNKDLHTRFKIISQLISDGSNAGQLRDDNLSILHSFFGEFKITAFNLTVDEYKTHADILQLLLNAGADSNQLHKKYGTPLVTMYESNLCTAPNAAPLYDVLFAQPSLDFDTPVTKKGAAVKKTLRQAIDEFPYEKPIQAFKERLEHYESKQN